MTDVSVVVVNFNTGDALASTLASLTAGLHGLRWNAVVVDNDSRDESQRAAQHAGDNVRLVRDGQTINLDMGRPDSQAAALQVRSGDRIIVPRSTNVFRDFLGPTASMVGAIAAIVSIFMR